MRKFNTAAAALVAALALAGAAEAADFEVQMLNRGEAGLMVFEPALIQIQPGDTVHFVATNPGHNAESITTLMPEGAAPFRGAMGKDVSVTFDVEGAYGIKCLPHFAMGMVAVVIVGDEPANLANFEAGDLPRKAQERVDAVLATL